MTSHQPRPLGEPVEFIRPAIFPSQDTKLSGQHVTLVGLTVEHLKTFYANLAGDGNAYLWDYMSDGPFEDVNGLYEMLQPAVVSEDTIAYAIIPTGQPIAADGADNVVGCASYMRVDLGNRTAETGVLYSPKLQRTPAATEAMYLMARHAFEDLGYRRYEWKCDSLNAASRRTALRFGFSFEGVFRKHMIVKGKNRDTAWFAMVDEDWPDVKGALQKWLDPSNFDQSGLQRNRLEDFRKK
ncbi:putative GNAT family acetyltransferase [Rosellinia necatrix]|uniref:Putative GNAT family acetyltransferase n=1 Tax=Rosellinia necatrix TaxID=77044 RepID=A0A1S7UND8_ROSNE|nr:putative GNAT family acetyltransferase [Rosellinia necatrix]